MATWRGAKALDLPTGALSPGLKADLLLVRLDDFHLQPGVAETVMTNLVHAARGPDVAMVMIDGRVVVQDGCLVDSRWLDLRQRARLVGLQLLEAAQAG